MVSRRNFLIAGGAGVGLVVAWAAWPRTWAPNLPVAEGESVLGAFLKIGRDGVVTVAVPQTEHGQGVYTALPQIVADELGADWATVAVEAAPVNPLYANPLAARTLFAGVLDRFPDGVVDEAARRGALMLTGGATSVRMFEQMLREAGATARQLLCLAAAKRWDVPFEDCSTDAGFVVAGNRRLPFGALAEDAAKLTPPDELTLRIGDEGRLTGQPLPRLDTPAKVDGSIGYAADVRLPDMLFASIRQGPIGATRLVSVDKAAGERVRGVISVVENPGWVAVLATTWWAAEQALAAMHPRFETRGAPGDTSVATTLAAAFDTPGYRFAEGGDVPAAFDGAKLIDAHYEAAPAFHAAIETPAATAHWHDDRLELWAATQAPGLVRAAAARAIGISPDAVTLHPMPVGGSFGEALELDAAVQAAMLAAVAKRPVQLVWSRGETLRRDRVRPPVRARLTARLAANGAILGWQTKIAAPATGAMMARRLMGDDALVRLSRALPAAADSYAMAGAVPPYRLPAFAIDHHPVDLGWPAGHLRGGAHGYTAFFTECFIDELARTAGSEPMSYRIGMLGGDARLARCLTTAAALGGWDGGVDGSGQGVACHAASGSCIAVLAEARFEGGRVKVDRLVAAIDCGRVINPTLVRQQVEGGMIFALAAATGTPPAIDGGMVTPQTLGALALPTLADMPEITVELVPSAADPGGVADISIAAVAPAIANALRAADGVRVRRLPLRP